MKCRRHDPAVEGVLRERAVKASSAQLIRTVVSIKHQPSETSTTNSSENGRKIFQPRRISWS